MKIHKETSEILSNGITGYKNEANITYNEKSSCRKISRLLEEGDNDKIEELRKDVIDKMK